MLVAKRGAHAREEGLAQLIVLVEDADLRIGLRGEDVLGVDAPLGAGGRVEADRPGEILGIVKLIGTGRDKQLRCLVLVEIGPNRQIGEAAKALKGERDAVFFYEPPGQLDGLGRAIAIIKADEVELAAVAPPFSLIILK